MPRRRRDPVAAATRLLEDAGIRKAPVPVELIARRLGAVIRRAPLDDELSGMLAINGDLTIIGVNSLHHPNRQRFTIAHECGHLALHRDEVSANVHVDRQFHVMMRDQKSSLGTDVLEIEANRFAAELLMPRFLVEPAIRAQALDVDDERSMANLAAAFRVSKSAMMYRVSSLLAPL
ncbi:ImmA/IrrE family metallo-endopeptidase [Craurococcus roseus]|uniref:ImmA/IrrE family metallo-endopeptidase n=1 Tax=Craurococcus roseus TaxID=77585 RepID=A0ABP3PST5_9PROT